MQEKIQQGVEDEEDGSNDKHFCTENGPIR